MTKLEQIIDFEVFNMGYRLVSVERDGDDIMAFCRKGSFGREACFWFEIEDGKIYFVKEVSSLKIKGTS